MIKLVAFDLDGTIADTIPMCIEAFKQAVTPYASKILSEDDIVKTFGLNEEGMIKQVVAEDWEKDLIDFYTIQRNAHNVHSTIYGNKRIDNRIEGELTYRISSNG